MVICSITYALIDKNDHQKSELKSDFTDFCQLLSKSKVEISFCEELHVVEARQCCWDQGSGTWPSWSSARVIKITLQ